MPSVFPALESVQIVGDRTVQAHRKVTQLTTPGGRFAIRAHAPGAVLTMPVSCEFISVTEIDSFWSWFESIGGSLIPFWFPTFQRDFVPIGTIADVDVEFTIRNRDYTIYEFPDPNRRFIAAVLPDLTIIKREITDAVNNGDGTETITINEAFGVEFSQRRNNGICYLLFCRLSDDAMKMEWWTHDTATVSFSVTELRGDIGIPTGSTL